MHARHARGAAVAAPQLGEEGEDEQAQVLARPTGRQGGSIVAKCSHEGGYACCVRGGEPVDRVGGTPRCELDGAYRPPLGWVGGAFDCSVLRK